jgi:signal transduction histidine kinase
MKSLAINTIHSKHKFINRNANLHIQNTTKIIKLKNVNKLLLFQNQEYKNKSTELKIANNALHFQNIEKEKRATELIIANKELTFQKNEKIKRESELKYLIKELEKAEKFQNTYINGLKEILFITSHNVRLPLANIIGISELLTEIDNTPEEINICIDYLKKSALLLENSTKELTFYLTNLEHTSKKYNSIKYV